ncbi:MAG: hypothetical protein JKY15_02165 [Deltaproteobacteria bacterium]|nr:hypothetical protein [Deltaproteobacteria bacterium]
MAQKEKFLKILSPIEEQIIDALEPVFAMENCELVDIKIGGSKVNPSLLLYVDKPSLGELGALSRLVSDTLDVANNEAGWFAGAYHLELSSPGLDRPLTKKSHFMKAVREMVRVKTAQGTRKEILQEAHEDRGICLEQEPKWVAWQEIQDARVIYRFPKSSHRR